jgi:hypothetical protein
MPEADEVELSELSGNAPVYNEDWERFSNGDTSDPKGWWTFNEGNVDDTRAWGGSLSYYINDDGAGGDPRVYLYADSPGQREEHFEFVYWETSNSKGVRMSLVNDKGQPFLRFGTDNPEVCITDRTGHNDIHTPTTDYQEWRRVSVDINWDKMTYDFRWEDLTGGDADQTRSNELMPRAPAKVSEIRIVEPASGSAVDSWIDDVTGFK